MLTAWSQSRIAAFGFSIRMKQLWKYISNVLISADNKTGTLLSSPLLWCCLFFNFTQFVILEDLSMLDLPLSGVKESSEMP